jgi:hypothetical protein
VTAPDPYLPCAPPPVDRGLARLHADMMCARSVVDNARRGTKPPLVIRRAAEADLLECLEIFASALAARRLPLPRGLRDELRLRRLLSLERQ